MPPLRSHGRGRAVEHARHGVRFFAVVDFHVEAAQGIVAQRSHHVAHAERCIDPAFQGAAALDQRVAADPVLVDRQRDDEAGLHRIGGFLLEQQLARHGRQPGIARLFERGAAHRLGQAVITESLQVAAGEGFEIDHRPVLAALAGRRHRIVREALGPHGGHVRFQLRPRHQAHEADALHAGKILAQLQALDIGVEFLAVDKVGTGKQALHAVQHLHIGLHARRDIVDQFTGTVVKAGAGVALGIKVGAPPDAAGRRQAKRCHQPRQQAGL